MTCSSFQKGWVERRIRKNGFVWLLRYRERDASRKDGWRIRSETLRHCEGKKEASKELERRMREVNELNNGSSRQPQVTLAEFVQVPWALYLDNKEARPSTCYSYDCMLRRHILPEFGSMLMEQIGPMQITRFFEKLRQHKLSSHYQLNFYALLRTLFELAVKYEILPASPIRKKLHRPRSRPREKPSLTAEQILQVLGEIPTPWKPLFLCLALTGLRIGELLALRWKNVDWESKKVRITHALWRGQLERPKTEASMRVLHLPEILYKGLRVHRERSLFTAPEDFLFCRADGTACDPGFLREQVLYPALDRVGIQRSPRRYGFHLFRHSAASIVHSETGSLKLAQKQLGHAKLSTTADIYVHTNGEDQEQAAEALAKAIDPDCSLFAHERPSAEHTIH